MKRIATHILIGLCSFLLQEAAAQAVYKQTVPPLANEKWWGGLVGIAHQMPYASETPWEDLSRNNYNNQVVPLMVSSEGRYIWSEQPFRYRFSGDTLYIQSEYERPEVVQAGSTLREAYLAASKAHFPPSGQIPEEIFFSKPQYNTWIELMYNQNQPDIMNYAKQVLVNGFPTGVFMVDDSWTKYYGNFEFKPERFSDPKAMIDTLHQNGFKLMVWVCPFVSPDSPEFRELDAKGFLLKKKDGEAAIIHWWNGFSACYDLTNPEAARFLKEKLREAQQRYGIDGFKFDAGDVMYMQGDYAFFDPAANANTFSQRWAELGLEFPYNELRTSFKLGGEALVQRLGDKDYSWNAVQMLIPGMTTAGLLGHAYTCPDMIGGGQFSSFLGVTPKNIDQELIVRSCQIHALMPMMQFSVAPWRILDEKHLAICRDMAHLHERMGTYILQLAKQAARTGEPIVRSMEYAFPHAGFLDCKDQFMLGDRYLVAPMVTPGTSRRVRLPEGTWRDDTGKRWRGPKEITLDVPLERLPYFERQ